MCPFVQKWLSSQVAEAYNRSLCKANTNQIRNRSIESAGKQFKAGKLLSAGQLIPEKEPTGQPKQKALEAYVLGQNGRSLSNLTWTLEHRTHNLFPTSYVAQHRVQDMRNVERR